MGFHSPPVMPVLGIFRKARDVRGRIDPHVHQFDLPIPPARQARRLPDLTGADGVEAVLAAVDLGRRPLRVFFITEVESDHQSDSERHQDGKSDKYRAPAAHRSSSGFLIHRRIMPGPPRERLLSAGLGHIKSMPSQRLIFGRLLEPLLRDESTSSDEKAQDAPITGDWWERNRRTVLLGLVLVGGLIVFQLMVRSCLEEQGVPRDCLDRFTICEERKSSTTWPAQR